MNNPITVSVPLGVPISVDRFCFVHSVGSGETIVDITGDLTIEVTAIQNGVPVAIRLIHSPDAKCRFTALGSEAPKFEFS